MTGSPEFDRDSAELFDFVSQFCADQDEGAVRPLAEYLARFPGQELAITAEYERLTRAEPAPAREPLRRIGHYEVLRELGSGGQGVVLLAEDTRLRRPVALKVLAPHLAFVSTERLHRFRREAEILSQLDHPAICPVYEADTCDGVPYLAMRYVEGKTLAATLRERRAAAELPRTRVQLHEVMAWIETAARAVHEAHEHGIVHRDIKPGNLMLTAQGTPVLLDFGLARHQATVDVEITRSGDVLGTLGYMAPELLSRRGADHRADIYALGVTLYECLTHALPFVGDSQTAVWRAIERGSAVPPRQHNGAIPPELAAVVQTAIAVSPAHRYATAAELADDLARVRRREPIHARSVPVAVRALRWVQRHPTLSLGLGAALVLIVALATSLDRVSANERAASALNQAILPSSTDEGAARALANLVTAAAGSPRADLRNAMLQVLDACHLSWQSPRTFVPAFTVDPPPAVAPSGRIVALADHDGRICVRDTASGERLAERTVHDGPAADVVFLDDERLVSAGRDGLRLLRAADLHELAALPLPRPLPSLPDATATPSFGLAISPDGDRLALGAPGSLSILSTRDWSVLATAALEVAPSMRRVAFSADGRHLVALGKERGADPHGCDYCWIVDSLDMRTQRIDAVDQAVLWAEWHPHAPVLALAYNGGRVEVRSAADGARRFVTRVEQEVNWCGFDPSGDLLLVPADRGTDLWRWQNSPPTLQGRLAHPSERTIGAAQFDRERQLFGAVLRDGMVLVYKTKDWRLLRKFKVPVKDVRYLAWLAHSGALLTADLDHLSSWLAGVRPHSPELWGHEDAVTTIAVHPDSRHLASGSRDRTARLWSLDEAAPLHLLQHAAQLRCVRFDGPGRRLLTIADDADARVFDVATGALLQKLHGHAANVADGWFLPDDRRAITIGDDGQTILWDLATGRAERAMQASPAPLRSGALHPDRPWIAVGGADRHVTVWDFASGERVQRIFCSEATDDWRINPVHQVRGLTFEPHHNRLFASLVNNVLAHWDLDTWQQREFGGDRFGSACIAAPGGLVLCADYSFGRLSLYRNGAIEALRIDGAEAHSNRISAIRVDAAGTAALSAGHDGQLFVWDLLQRVPVQSIRTEAAILDAQFSPDGAWVATGGADGRIKLWPRDPLRTAREYLARRSAGSVR